jgi:hypothetical protein
MVSGERHFSRQFDEQDKNGSVGGCAGCNKGYIMPRVALEVNANPRKEMTLRRRE